MFLSLKPEVAVVEETRRIVSGFLIGAEATWMRRLEHQVFARVNGGALLVCVASPE